MRDDTLLTLKQLADQLGLPESTVRYYRDAFLDHIPSVGTGRRRRYPAQAVAVLRSIAKQYASGKARADIERAVRGNSRSAPVAVAPAPAPAARAVEDVTNVDLLAAILDGEREQRDALWQMAREIVRLADVLERQDGVLTDIAAQAGVAVLAPAEPPKARIAAAPANHAATEPAEIVVPGVATPPLVPAAPASPAALAPDAPAPIAPAPTAGAAAAEPPVRVAALDVAAPAVTDAEPARSEIPRASWSSSPAPVAPAASVTTARPDPVAEPTAVNPEASARATSPYHSSEIDKLRQALESERELVERLREAKVRLEHRVTDAESQLEDNRRPARRTSVIGRLLGGHEDS